MPIYFTVMRKEKAKHNTIFLCYLGYERGGDHDEIDDQYRNPNINNRDHLVGQLTSRYASIWSGLLIIAKRAKQIMVCVLLLLILHILQNSWHGLVIAGCKCQSGPADQFWYFPSPFPPWYWNGLKWIGMDWHGLVIAGCKCQSGPADQIWYFPPFPPWYWNIQQAGNLVGKIIIH